MKQTNNNSTPVEPQPPPGHENLLSGLRKALTVSKAEIDRREKEWQETTHKRGRPKKDDKVSP